jgi:uncharacterized protein YndB with AHSA1/START domain
MSRSHETRIEIHAPREAVWRALTDAEELSKWFVEKARIEPREGGAYWREWDQGMTGEARIDAFEPARRLRLSNPPVGSGADTVWQLTDEAELMVEEYILEDHGDVTVLRVVQSGMPDSTNWDGFYEGTRRGWQIALCGLRYYLERHLGEPRQRTDIRLTTSLSQSDAFNRLRRSLKLDGQVIETIEPFGIVSATDTALAILRTQTTAPGSTMVWLSIATYGQAQPPSAELQRELKGTIEAALA